MESKYGRGNEDIYDSKYSSGSKALGRQMSEEKPSISLMAESKPSTYLSSSGSKGILGAKSVMEADFKAEKAVLDEIAADLEADEEFERLKTAPSVPKPLVAKTVLARNFVRGFKIISMNMRDAESGRLMWRSTNWDIHKMFTEEVVEEIPQEILHCRVVSREMIFSSIEEMHAFRLEQRVYFKGVCMEEWFFRFGYVMSGSRNSWQQTIDAAPPAEMLPASVLSDNVVFETSFFDGTEFLCKNTIRIRYV